MAIDRRRFLALGPRWGWAIYLSRPWPPKQKGPPRPRGPAGPYLSAQARRRDETALLDESGRDLRVVPMPARGQLRH